MRERRRWLLWVVLASIVLNAAFGIYALVGPDLGRRAEQVLATSACVTGAGIFTLGCLPAWERRRLRLVAAIGIVASILGFGMLALGAWLRTESSTYWQAAGTAVVVASFAELVSLLALARLPDSYRAVFPAAVVLAAVLAGMIVFAVWDGDPSSTYGKAMGVVAVLLAAATVATPVLHRAARSEPAAEPPPSGVELRFCPSCGRRVPRRRGRRRELPGVRRPLPCDVRRELDPVARTRRRSESLGRCLRCRLGSGLSAAPGRHSLALLPPGPDAVRRLPVRGT